MNIKLLAFQDSYFFTFQSFSESRIFYQQMKKSTQNKKKTPFNNEKCNFVLVCFT